MPNTPNEETALITSDEQSMPTTPSDALGPNTTAQKTFVAILLFLLALHSILTIVMSYYVWLMHDKENTRGFCLDVLSVLWVPLLLCFLYYGPFGAVIRDRVEVVAWVFLVYLLLLAMPVTLGAPCLVIVVICRMAIGWCFAETRSLHQSV
jgi:hypothetical protein